MNLNLSVGNHYDDPLKPFRRVCFATLVVSRKGISVYVVGISLVVFEDELRLDITSFSFSSSYCVPTSAVAGNEVVVKL